MKQKFQKLSRWSLALAVILFAAAFLLFHYMTPEMTFTTTFRTEPGKPMVTEMVAMLGVLFLFSSILSGMIGKIFFSEKK